MFTFRFGWGDSFVYHPFTIIGLVVFAVVLSLPEFFFQSSEVRFLFVLGANLLYFASLWVLLYIIEYVYWCLDHYTTVQGCVTVCLVVLFSIALPFLKAIAHRAIDINFAHAWIILGIPLVFEFIALALCAYAYIVALAEGYQH